MRATCALFLASGMVLGGTTLGPSASAVTTGHGGGNPAQAPVPDVLGAQATYTPPPSGVSRVLTPTATTTPCDVVGTGAGTPPAIVAGDTSGDCPTDLTLTVQAGTLQVQVPNTWSLGEGVPGSTLSSNPTNPAPGYPDGFMVSDTRGEGITGSDWTVSVNLQVVNGAAAFVGPTESPGTNYHLGDVTYDPGTATNQESPPVGTITGPANPPVLLPSTGTAVEVLSATHAPGITSWIPTLNVVIPPAAPAGTYTATLSTSVTAA
jgi:hypothetical protein